MGLISQVKAKAVAFAINSVLPRDYQFMIVNNSDGTQRVIEGSEYSSHASAYYSNAFRACLLAKARPLASLPIRVYERDGEFRKSAESAFALALSKLLTTKWNPFMTSSEGIRWAMMTRDILGNAFVRVSYDQNGLASGLWPLATSPTVCIDNGRPLFKYGGDKFTPAGTYLEHEILWLKSPILDQDCLYGRSLAELAASELNLSITLEEFYSRILGGEGTFAGWLETDQKLNPQELEQLRIQLRDGGGLISAGAVRVFDKGLTYKSNGQTMADMSLVEQEKWILQQTCRTLSVPPQEVFELSHATYSNIEQGAINFANKTLVPECAAFEQAFSSILWAAGYTTAYVQFDMNGLLRGSFKERMEGYRIGWNIGLYSSNRIAEKEDERPFVGGDYHAVPSAYSLIKPDSGEIISLAKSSNNSNPQPGGMGETGEGGRGNAKDSFDAHALGTALGVVQADMERRILERYSDTGDTEKFRNFAENVLRPLKATYGENRLEFDTSAEIERIIQNG